MASLINAGIPQKLLKEFKSRKISVETNSGEVFKGKLLESEDNLSVSLDDVKATLIDGKIIKMEGVYIRGSRIRLVQLPESASDYLPQLTRPPTRGRGGFRGGRRGGGGSRPSFGRR